MQTFEEMESVYNNAPQKVKNMIDICEPTYKELTKLCKKLNKRGYSANFGLDGELTELKKL